MQAGQSGNAQGIDVSRYQGTIDWKRVKAAGKTFVFAKASQGATYRDSTFTSNIQGARAAGLFVGAYHFLTATSSVTAQAEASHFVTVMQSVGAMDLPPVMDYENNPNSLTTQQINTVALTFLQEVERLSGHRPIVYTGNSFGQNFNATLGIYDLWIARYSSSGIAPKDTAAWKQWTFWQYSDAGQVDGIKGPVDLNQFQGSIELLLRYIQQSKASSRSSDVIASKSLPQQKSSSSGVVQADAVSSVGSASTEVPEPVAPAPIPTAVTYVGGTQTVQATGLLIDNKNYIPLRELQSVFGFTVGFDAATKTATVNGQPIQDGRLVNNRTYVQAAPLVASFHGTLSWDNESKSLTIHKG